MIKVGFYLENAAIADVDLSRPELGNPGCGGTEYLFSSLPHYLGKYGKNRCHPVLFANRTGKLPANVETVEAADAYDAARKAKAAGCALFVYRPKRQSETDILDLFESLDLPAILWVHVTPTMPYVRAIARCPSVRAFVCVEHEQQDQICDSPLREKLTFIVNGFDLDGFRSDLGPVQKDPDLVVYLGALVPQKGFHMLARAWPEIVKARPSARLVVIGSGALYDNRAVLGPWGVAQESYERQEIIPFLSGPDGNPLPSVRFAGRMGLEKKALLAAASVGVPNPTGQGENCPGSVLEFSALGTAVVSGARYGMLDTVLHGETGLLGHDVPELVRNVLTLLENPELAASYGRAGVDFVRERYDYKRVVDEWCDLFARAAAGQAPRRKLPKRNILAHYKVLRIANRPVQETLGRIVRWPSVEEIKEGLVRVLAKRGRAAS